MKLKFVLLIMVSIILTGCLKSEGKIRISSNQAGAEIFVDEIKKAETSDGYTTITVSEGDHLIYLVKKYDEWYYLEAQKNVFVGKDSISEVSLRLNKKLTPAGIDRERKIQEEKLLEKELYDEAMSSSDFDQLVKYINTCKYYCKKKNSAVEELSRISSKIGTIESYQKYLDFCERTNYCYTLWKSDARRKLRTLKNNVPIEVRRKEAITKMIEKAKPKSGSCTDKDKLCTETSFIYLGSLEGSMYLGYNSFINTETNKIENFAVKKWYEDNKAVEEMCDGSCWPDLSQKTIGCEAKIEKIGSNITVRIDTSNCSFRENIESKISVFKGKLQEAIEKDDCKTLLASTSIDDYNLNQ